MTAKECTDDKMFQFRNDLLWTGQEITYYGQKHFRETNNYLCEVSTAQTMRKENKYLHEIIPCKSNEFNQTG